MNGKAKSSYPTWVDPDDAPEITGEWIASADEYIGGKLVRRGGPVGGHKTAATIRFDDEIIETFKLIGKGWQTRMNAALKDWLTTHMPA
jgi:uncharacterized protein (DUF4415 family)